MAVGGNDWASHDPIRNGGSKGRFPPHLTPVCPAQSISAPSKVTALLRVIQSQDDTGPFRFSVQLLGATPLRFCSGLFIPCTSTRSRPSGR